MGKKSRIKRESRIIRAEMAPKPASPRLTRLAGITLAGGALLSYASLSEFGYIENTINGFWFFALFFVVGLAVGGLIYLVLRRAVPELKDKGVRRETRQLVPFFCAMGFAMATPASASFLNRHYPAGPKECGDYPIIRKDIVGARSKEDVLFVQLPDTDKRLSVTGDVYRSAKVGASIRLCIQRGILGFDYIEVPE